MLALRMEKNYEVHRWNGFKWRDKECKFHGNRFRHLSNTTIITTTIWEAGIFSILMVEGIYGVCRWGGCMWCDMPTSVWNVVYIKYVWVNWQLISPLWRSQIHLRFCVQAIGRICRDDYRPLVVDSAQFVHVKGTTAAHVACTKLKFAFSPQSALVRFVWSSRQTALTCLSLYRSGMWSLWILIYYLEEIWVLRKAPRVVNG
jgi:hypothetical protein